MTPRFKVGDRVEWHRSGYPFGGYLCGYITDIYPFHGAVKARIRSNGRVFSETLDRLTLAN